MNPFKAANSITVTKGAFGLAGAAVGVAGTVAREAAHVPAGMTKGATHLASTVAGLVDSVARETAQALWSGRSDEQVVQGPGSTDVTDEPTIPGPTTAEAASTAVSDVAGAPTGPTVVPAEPHAPEEPPVDVVGDTLDAEGAAEPGEGPGGAGIAHEPRGASRDEEHGDATLQRAEVEEIAQETAAALEGDVAPEGHPDEPLFDSAAVKGMAAELATMSRAADTNKG